MTFWLLYTDLFNLPNWSFFITTTYFSSRDLKTDKGLGFTAAFLEYSANFLSVVIVARKKVKK